MHAGRRRAGGPSPRSSVGWPLEASLQVDAWVLFAIMFLWQVPHTLAIARLYRDDYAKAGIQFLPVIEPDGASTNRQIISHCAALLAVSLLPTLLGFAGAIYFLVAFVLGVGFLASGIGLAMESTLAWRAPAAVCLVDLFAGAFAGDGVGSCSAMSELLMDQFGSVRRRNRRLGLILALLIVLYIARGDCLYHYLLRD